MWRPAGKSGSPYNAVIERRTVDHQKWDLYGFLGLLFTEGDQQLYVAPGLSGRTVEAVEFISNIGRKVFLRQLESFEQTSVHDVARGPCVNQDSTNVGVGHRCSYEQRNG